MILWESVAAVLCIIQPCFANTLSRRSVAAAVYVWGRGEYGRLGLGDRTGSSKLRPTRVKGMANHRCTLKPPRLASSCVQI